MVDDEAEGASGGEGEFVSSLAPRMQANFLCAFSFGYTSLYSFMSYFYDREQLPGVPYFAVLAFIYALFWAPFYLRDLTLLPGVAVRVLIRLSDLLTRTSVPTRIAVPPKDQGTLFAPRQAERPAESRWPLRESIMVQCLATSVIIMTAWYCTYSGGPFQSPYGQILLALPLLAPNIAAKSKSILGVYAATAVSALLFQFAFTPSTAPNKPWYVWTTLGVLAISALVSWLTRRKQEDVAQVRTIEPPDGGDDRPDDGGDEAGKDGPA